ncbi:hypothetical protein J2Y69_000902 [Microbacterium resistens]|uniref:Glycosyltransferase 2-like domain-containing protein n=1 Tax=Microbacterium resistens TaxID=156977 RepID=A0ABU1S9P5_9MICO|nr:glycosyltransferase [Microbacterium resistens]MDR6866310.1 hypothetical protein [Microbacterium resistens]
MSSPAIDVTIAVHSASRPIARAVASIIDHTEAPVRVNVVAHNIDPDIIRTHLGPYADHPQVRLLSLQDGIHSPAGPMNHGLDHSTAPFVSVMGSDDELAPGALDSWLALQRQTGADAVIAKIRLVTGGVDPYPPVRDGRRLRDLDGTRDRLSYRSAPLGLISRDRFGDLRFTAGLASGEDLAYTATVWFTGRHLAYDLEGPPYVGHDDAEDRVTSDPRPLLEDFRFLYAIEAMPWLRAATRAQREALVVKLLRIHVFDGIAARISTASDREALSRDLASVLSRLHSLAPFALRLLSRADRRVLDAVLAGGFTEERMTALLAARWNYRTIGAMLPRNPALALHPQAPFRTLRAGSRAAMLGESRSAQHR